MSDGKRLGTSRAAIYMRNKRKSKRLFSTCGTKLSIPKNFFHTMPVLNSVIINDPVDTGIVNTKASNNLISYETSDTEDDETGEMSTNTFDFVNEVEDNNYIEGNYNNEDNDQEEENGYQEEYNDLVEDNDYHDTQNVITEVNEENNFFTDDDEDIDNESDENELFSINSTPQYQYPLISKRYLKIKDHFLSVIATSIKHRMSYEAVLDILRWIKSSHVISGLPTTKAALWRALNDSIASKTKAYIFKTLKVFDETVQTGSRDKFIFEGKPTIRSLTRDESIVLRAAGYTPEKITIYGRMQLNKIKFSSVNPQLQTKISDSFIFNERDGVFYEIKKIVSFKIDNNLISGLIVRSFSHDYYGFETQFISAVVENKLSFIHETNRIRPAIKINTNGVTYAIKLANCWETD
ncbi:hypothetical protein KQX54_012371 [Cotesia glomerata]|uniref:Uncharacterized protein n=1 Tax=Cotesia glomerata TaxID=32391 RepID=A0AAV7I4G4_COTGL|nr:hypothetical protein KQX54_012371 [Cotesia glomerata]